MFWIEVLARVLRSWRKGTVDGRGLGVQAHKKSSGTNDGVRRGELGKHVPMALSSEKLKRFSP